MKELKERARVLVSEMTLEEKASLCSGIGYWRFKGIERLGLPSVAVSDGPHGLRKQVADADHLGINTSAPATCFPTAAGMACSFDRVLMREVGRALGEECCNEGISMLLGPGINIKRSPLCGRNFEYFSEDPYLAGRLAAAYVSGVESKGVSVSCKHFALNNQEKRRMTTESVADERAMREIYLSAFEHVVKTARPHCVMSSYNKLCGEYAADSRMLLTDILRDEWGFDALVISDWGGESDRVSGVRAGLDVEMPSLTDGSDKEITAAVRAGVLDEEAVDACAARVTEFILWSEGRDAGAPHECDHHALAKRVERESAVLLKNEGSLLPGSTGQSAAVLGAFAKHPRYQGAGSSKINPVQLDNAFDALRALGLSFDYAAGYSPDSEAPDDALIKEACEAARGKDIVYIFAGLPDRYESEGFDRDRLTMPEAQTELIRRVAEVNPNVAVVLSGGSVIDMAWEGSAKAVLMGYLGGEAGAPALAELILGAANPSGKLAESWPMVLSDNPSFAYFPGYEKSVEYRESIFVGYRYYDTAGLAVRYPFGHGLSYTRFEYENPRLDGMSVSVDIVNTGSAAGAETVQLYTAPPKSAIFKAAQELKGFEKVFLRPGERSRVTFKLTPRDFAFYDTTAHGWRVEAGEYGLRIGASSRDIRHTLILRMEESGGFDTPVPDYRESAPCYYDLSGGIANVPDADFTALYGAVLPRRTRDAGAPHTRDSTVADIQDRWLVRKLYPLMTKIAVKTLGEGEDTDRLIEHVIPDAPLRLLLMTGSFSHARLDGLVDMLNGKFFRGLWRLIRG